MRLVDFLGRLDVILQIGYGVFPGLQSLGQQSGRLRPNAPISSLLWRANG